MRARGASPLTPYFSRFTQKIDTMAYGLIRVRNLSAEDLTPTEIHNFRQYEEKGIALPSNIDPDNDPMENTHSVLYRDGQPIECEGGQTEEIKKRLAEQGITPRKNSVMALEYAVGASPEFFVHSGYNAQAFLEKAADFVAQRHGKDNLVSVSFHFDESNPHAHVIVLPITEKTVKWKNKNGSGERTEKRLCARDFTGGPKKLEALQDDYYQFCTQFNGRKQPPSAINMFNPKEVVFYRGTKAAEQLKHYTKKTNHEIGLLRGQILACEDLAEVKALQKELEAKKAEFLAKTTEQQQRIEIKKEQNAKIDPKTQDKKWKKGKGFRPGF